MKTTFILLFLFTSSSCPPFTKTTTTKSLSATNCDDPKPLGLLRQLRARSDSATVRPTTVGGRNLKKRKTFRAVTEDAFT